MTETEIEVMPEKSDRMVKEAVGRRMSKRTAQRRSRRREEIARGRVLALLATVAAVLFYAAFLVATLGDFRFGYRDDTTRYVSAGLIVGTLTLMGALLAIAAYRGHPVLRPLYLTLNGIGGLAGLVFLSVWLAKGTLTVWNLLDLYGVVTAFFVGWVFFLSVRAHKFFSEQAMTVKRK